jgi:general secretion pathway protein D
MKKIIFTVIIAMVLSAQIFSQEYLEKTLRNQNPDELISLSSNISFNQAVTMLSNVSEKISGKRIVSTVKIDSVIGLNINNMNYFKAMVVLTKMEGLIYQEKPDVIIIKRPSDNEGRKASATYVPITEREVKISAVFFEADVAKERQMGMNWQTLFSKSGLNIGINSFSFSPDSNTTSVNAMTNPKTQPTGAISANSEYTVGKFTGSASAIFKFFENHNAGEIITSPNVTVLDGTEAKLQDGQDIAINQKDFSGNIIQKFYSIGSIVVVTPYILQQKGVNYILLNIHVERSSFVPGATNIIINKTAANTKVVLLNGEETVIGGLFFNQTTKQRNGIPFLKDLPWWFFGLRYIFGYDDNIVNKKELVILIKADLVPSIQQRLATPQSTTPLKDELQLDREKIKNYQSQSSKSSNNDQ